MGLAHLSALSADRIYGAALRLIDDEGVAAFTLERLASRLGVRAPSLYNHVASKAAIVEGVRDLIVAEIDYSSFTSTEWDFALEQFTRSYRTAFGRHPNTVALLFTTPVRAVGTYQMYEAVVTALSAAGWPSAKIVPVVSAVEYLIAGAVLDRSAVGMMFADASALGAPTLAAGQPSGRTQLETADEAFDLALAALLIGLREQFAMHRVNQ